MKTLCIIAALMVAVSALALDPQTATITNLRDEADGYVSTNEYYRGTILLFTNCVAYSGTSTSSAREDLTGVSIVVKAGLLTSNTTYSGTAQVATSGTWSCSITLPTNQWSEISLQVQLTNSAAKYIYPAKFIKLRPSL